MNFGTLCATVMVFWGSLSSASLMYIPANFRPETARVVVLIHGCLQSAESIAFGAGWNQIADRNNLAILYPQVPDGTNILGCWSWYSPSNQRPDSGQLKMVMQGLDSFMERLNIKSDRPIFVAGISSGAATVAGLMACFPNRFVAGAIHSGPSYGLAQNLKDGDRVLKEGPPQETSRGPCKPIEYTGSVVVVQGEADTVVHPSHGLRVIADFIGNVNAVGTRQVDTGKTKYTVSDYLSSQYRRGRLILVRDLPHAWSGFPENMRFEAILGPSGRDLTKVPYFSESGPSATNLIWEFFRESGASSSTKSNVQESK